MGIFERKVSFIDHVKATSIGGGIPLIDFFNLAKSAPTLRLIDDARRYARQRKEKDDEPSRMYTTIKSMMPGAVVSGIIPKGYARKESNLTAHTGLISIDVDRGENPDIDFADVKRMLSEFDCVAYCALSLSGDGLFCIIPIDMPCTIPIPPIDADGTERVQAIKRVKALHVGQFEALKQSFKLMGLKVDEACKDISRIRVLSHDDAPYINPDAVPYPHFISPPLSLKKSKPRRLMGHRVNEKSLESWLIEHHIPFDIKDDKFCIDCPWEHLHTADTGDKQTCVWEEPDGRFAFHCFHGHCDGKGWKEFRQAVAPTEEREGTRRNFAPPPPRHDDALALSEAPEVRTTFEDMFNLQPKIPQLYE